MKILILGITGMLGHKFFLKFSENSSFDVYGSVRKKDFIPSWVPGNLQTKIISDVAAENISSLKLSIENIKPDVVINCIGIIKQLPSSEDPYTAISINSLLPHQIAKICADTGCRMIHISTDCVFDGLKGNYTEDDNSTALDLYGKSKYLGEVNYKNTITLRTSIIGHEINSSYGLIEWFLSQKNKTKGYTKAIFTGFPTIEIADIIEKFILPNSDLEGLYNITSNPITKFDLLKLVAFQYGKNIEIEADDSVTIDRSMNSSRFRLQTDYESPDWRELIKKMFNDYDASGLYRKYDFL